MRRRCAWLVAVPLMLAGSQAAHALAYALVYPQSTLRLDALARTGHAYFQLLPFALGVAAAVALVGLLLAVVDTVRGRPVRDLPPVAFALLPPVAFAAQELIELSLHTGTFGWHAFAAPTFVPGLALQLPFAVLAYAVARLLLRAAERVGIALRAPLRARRFAVRLTPLLLSPGRLVPTRRSARAPPRVVVV